MFVNVLLHGRWFGPPGSPVAFETEFGWVLAGETESCAPVNLITLIFLLGDQMAEMLKVAGRRLVRNPSDVRNSGISARMRG